MRAGTVARFLMGRSPQIPGAQYLKTRDGAPVFMMEDIGLDAPFIGISAYPPQRPITRSALYSVCFRQCDPGVGAESRQHLRVAV